MSRPFTLGIAVLLGLAVAPAPLIARLAQGVFSARTEIVSVTVSVMKGREAVADLAATDFALTDNGVPQTVQVMSLEQVPLDMTMVLTGFASDRGREHLRGLVSAEALRQRLLPADRLRVVSVNADIEGRLVGRDSLLPLQPAPRNIAGISLFDGLFYALAWPVQPDRRHLVVAFTDGSDTWSTLEPDVLVRLAAHSEAVLHAVWWATPADGPGSNGNVQTFPPSAALPDWEASYRAVDAAVRRTGGTVQRTSGAPDTLGKIVEDFRRSYVLRYTPHGVPTSGWHDLRVKVTRPGSFTIRARSGHEGG